MSDQSEQNPFRSRRFVLALVVVGVIAICAVFVLISNLVGGKNDAAPTTSPSSSASATPATPVDSDPSACGLKGYEATSSLNKAPETTWALVGTSAAPTDPKGAGPGVTDSSGFRSCYAHTATGALFAAANYVALGTDATMYDKQTSLIAPGAGREAAEKSLAGGNNKPSGVRAQIAGFTITSYDSQNATVDLVLNFSDGQLASGPVKLLWVEGDWKVVLLDDGTMPIAPAGLENLGGYTPWAGA